MTAFNESFVRDRIERLREDYGEFPVEDDVVDVPPAAFPEYVANARDGYVGSAYAWTVRRPEQAGEPSESYSGGEETRERALLILPRGDSAWGVPGGGREGEEDFEQTAAREVREEAGVACSVTEPWLAVHARWRSEDAADDRVSHTLHVFFDATYEGDTISVQRGEVNGAAWFAERPRRLDEYAARRADAFF
ncbi:NUDIX hydrolase [Halobacterium yunchengense]|uniref:NUDIX hydrolase n=1 Tax=Halobacterium yunchengense TaxID=3108497 RepID=UPI003009D0D9